MTIELLTIEECPNDARARQLLERVAPGQPVDVVVVRDRDDAAARRFLGSPTIRVDDRDIEPGADERTDYAIGCRIYANGTGVPDERWVRDALARQSS